MSNTIRHLLEVEIGDFEEFKKLVLTKDEEGTRFDYSRIVPRPKDLDVEHIAGAITAYREKYAELSAADKHFMSRCGDLSPENYALADKYKSNIDKYGHATWVSWNAENWGADEPWDTVVNDENRTIQFDGKIRFLNDCTHELAGQTVELPEL